MATFKIKISDTVTYLREYTIDIEAETLEDALEEALEDADEIMGLATYATNPGEPGLYETQIDNTPYEVCEDLPSATPSTPRGKLARH